ncbi:gamma-interferon-inducible lysosomal thiol reductase-like [Paramacrobiotus metropolitanus]|uniref:gamma-interferon-inducible lysosomal thiol reductase-like n=1 Tax=Paramacrobiotus metropolitanus TaxID=2943436 RepID=UPI0024463088|nr:gamma-interferon-inducible lysosomal thiol reductase-like [Paramacrobiotus metropolitanus]
MWSRIGFLGILAYFHVGAGLLLKNRAVNDAPLVIVDVYYEALCPDSVDFIVKQLYPTMQSIGHIANVSLIPYGFATETFVDGQWVFKCQHGPKECKANIIQSCAIHFLDPGPGSYLHRVKDTVPKEIEFVNCMESSEDPSTAGPKCAKKQRIKYGPISACAKGSEGNYLQHIMAQKTEALNPQPGFIPWINFNGAHTEANQDRALQDLTGLVCDLYTGEKPSQCKKEI